MNCRLISIALIIAGLVVAIAAAVETGNNKSKHVLETRFFTTRLDHFTPTDGRTVNMVIAYIHFGIYDKY